MDSMGRAQWLIIFLTYPVYTMAPFCIGYSFININCSFSNSTELLIPANVFHYIVFPVVLKKAAGGKKSLFWVGFMLSSLIWIIQWDLKGPLALAPF